MNNRSSLACTDFFPSFSSFLCDKDAVFCPGLGGLVKHLWVRILFMLKTQLLNWSEKMVRPVFPWEISRPDRPSWSPDGQR